MIALGKWWQRISLSFLGVRDDVGLGLTPKQGDLLRSTVSLCEGRVGSGSIYGVLHRECFTLFPDEMFAPLAGPGSWRRA